jgi:hypothetical protein
MQAEIRMLFLTNQEMRRQLLKDDAGLKELRVLRIRVKELESQATRGKRLTDLEKSVDSK